MNRNIDIIGTCYTRELFNTSDNYIVKNYLMQQSIFTIFSSPLVVDIQDVRSKDNYNFKNRMLFYEFNKSGLEYLAKNHSKILIIDLLDQGRDIIEFTISTNVKIILTHDTNLTIEYLKTTDKYKNISLSIFEVQKFSDDELKYYLNQFIRKLLEFYEEEDIILNISQIHNVYYENNEKKFITNNWVYDRRKFIKKLETLFLELLPRCKVLKTNFPPIIDINHRFGGPHPAHFENVYYQYRMKMLDAVINNQSADIISMIDKEYDNLIRCQIENIKSKVKTK